MEIIYLKSDKQNSIPIIEDEKYDNCTEDPTDEKDVDFTDSETEDCEDLVS